MPKQPSSHLYTIADPSQFSTAFEGPSLQGHREPRVAFVGRSNVGKSSLVNQLLGLRLAYTSKQPGKTRAIQLYVWGSASKIIVDLPGYGYARVSREERMRWEKFIQLYFETDPLLERALVLWDSRHGPTEQDLEAIDFLSLGGIPITLVLTKVDLLKTQALRHSRRKEVEEVIKKHSLEGCPVFWVSSDSGVGMKELWQHLTRE